VSRLSDEENRPATWPGSPRPILSETLKKFKQNPTKFDFQTLSALSFNPTELARQITLFDHKIFAGISLAEFVRKKFTKAESAPGIHTLIERFNLVTKWVGTEVATTPNIKQRIKSLVHFICVAEELKKIQNYHSFSAVVTGLSQFAVQRLKLTWTGLPQKSLELFQEFESLATPMKNFHRIREACQKATPPFILPLAMLCKDLTFY